MGPNDLDGLLVLKGVTSDFLDWFGPVGVDPHGPVWPSWAQYPRIAIFSLTEPFRFIWFIENTYKIQ
jgi:hypothetical protein